jgi:hypothetical protein
MKLARSFGIALLALPVMAAWSGGPAPKVAQQSPFGDVTLTVTPTRYVGKCPVRLHFFGKVSVTVHPMVFNYTFERSDGAKGELKVIRVTNPNAQIIGVHDWWQLGGPGQHIQVWEKVHVASGNTRIESNQADADITCK